MGLDQSLYNGEQEVAYWRKANQIHAWFEDAVANGALENTMRYPVSQEQLAGLVARCERVLADPSLAQELLAPRQGFFFGAYEVDDRYMRQLRETVDMIKPLLGVANAQYAYWAWW